MKINELNAYFSYENLNTANSTSKTAETSSKQKQDGLEISSEAQALLNKQQAISNDEKKYDLNTIMQLHKKENKTPEELELYRTARRNDSQLDVALYEMDKAEALEFVGKVQNILLKALTNQKLTPEEQEMVKEDFHLQQEIQRRKSPYFI